jgi:hypothetical protein
MNMLHKLMVLFAFLTLVAIVALVVGCSDSRSPATSQTSSGAEPEHAHKPGEHGGTIFEIGRDSYHAEAVFEKGGVVRLYMLGQDEARIQEVELQTLAGYVKPEGDSEAVSIVFRPVPQTGDSAGKTSQFVAGLPRELAGKSLEVTIPSIRIAGERFRLGFRSSSAGHEEDMLDKVSGDEEKQLYLTPGGKYTAADIEANGNTTASQKFKGLQSSHDLKPKPGDRICPITRSKANPKFSWVVGGQTYQFCCPPCIDELVKTAKEHPDQIKEPGSYVKK